MQQTYAEYVNNALDVLAESLHSYVQSSMETHYGDTWRNYLPTRITGYAVNWDAQAILHTMTRNWGEVFRSDLDDHTRNLIGELIEWRNRAAHRSPQEPINADDAQRAVDTVWRLLMRMSLPQAQQVRDSLTELERQKASGYTQSQPSVSFPTRRGNKMPSQRDVMRQLVKQFGVDEDRVVREYAAAEQRGEVQRSNNASGLSAIAYARALWADAVKKGWIDEL